MLAWRIAKSKYAVYDGTGASHAGGRWNSRGRAVIYAADSYAGAILEILAHSFRPRTLPGRHHAVEIDIPDEVVEILASGALPGWDARESQEALQFGDRWLNDSRSAVLVVPSVAARPIGNNVLINPAHSDAGRIRVSDPFAVPWDERLF